MDTRDYIGFATLPEQVHRKSVKKGFEFTLMVAGDSGLGKSTLINSLFLTDLYSDRVIPPVQDRIETTTAIEERTVEIEEKGVKLRLTVVDTPGFGDSLQSEGTCQALSDYIDAQFRHYFTAESGLHRKAIQDRRVNACLYFIPPYGHGLRQLDAEVMLRLHRKVNLVPIIAKADTLTPVELSRLKRQVLADLEHYRIQVYQLPECDSEEDEEFLNQDRELKAALPFAIVASTQTFEIAGKTIRGRQYPWGIVEVDNALHSDFVKLRTMLISTHMADLKEITNDHYEQFRAQCIAHISQQAIKERGKLKRDSMNVECVTTDALLQEKEEEIRRMQDMLAAMQQQLSQAQLKQSTSSTPNSPNMVRV